MATNSPIKSKSREQLIAELDEKLRLNRGQFTNLASDTGSNVGFLTQQGRKVQDPAGMGFQNPQINFDIPQAPSIPQFQEQQPAPEQPQGEVLGESTELPENPSAEQMLQAIFSAAWEPQLPSSEQLEYLYQETGQLYPIQNNSDGTITMNDGSIQEADQEAPMPIASMADGSVLWSDGFLREKPPGGLASYLAGVSGLSQFLFGEDQAVTQDYGNYNPELEPGSGYNMGTDFRTRDLSNRQLFAPVPMQVVEVYYDDGTQWGDQSGHQGYGNSVLLMLPSGEYLRLSHLSNMGQFQVGDTLNPGDVIGMPGQTGNTQGEHLDVEYYNTQGQIDNPNNFRANVQQYNMSSQLLGTSPYGSPQINEEAPQQPSAPQPVQYPGQTIQENIVQPAVDTVKAGIDTVKQLPQQAGQVLGAASQEVNEALQPMSPQRQALASGVETVGQATGLPERYVSEATSGVITPGMAIRKNIEEIKPTGDKYDSGLSELFSGDTEGAKNIFLSNVDRAKNRLGRIPGQIKDEAIPQAYAAGGELQDVGESLGDNLSYLGSAAKEYGQKQVGRFSDVVKQADEGLRGLGESFSSKVGNIFQKSPLSAIGGDRAVGEASPGGDQNVFSQNSLVNSKAFTPTNDNRDDFFKSGKSGQFNEYLRETPADGALSLGIFNDDFYKDSGRVSEVFGNTFLGKEATERFKETLREKYSSGEYDQEDVERLISSIPSVIQGGLSLREPAKAQEREKPSLDEYLAQGKTAAQWYAETGQQSKLDSLRSDSRNRFNENTGEVTEVGQTSQSSQVSQPTMSVGPKQGVTNSINSAARGQTYTSPSGNQIKNYTPANANMSDASTGLPVFGGQIRSVAPSKQSNIFSRATSKIRNIFGR